jgi:hypothetical protein
MNTNAEIGEVKKRSRLHSWGLLLFSLFLVWGFAFVLGPWVQKKIPIMDEMFTLIEERNINSNAYFYTEIEASYDGEKFLLGAIRLSDPSEARLNFFFITGVIACILLLVIGYRYLPME